MELNVEVNKYFAEEMARHIIATISDEELEGKAKAAWNEIRRPKNAWETPELSKMVKATYTKAVMEKVEALLESDDYRKMVADDAEKVVDEIIKESRRKMIEEVSSRMAGFSTGFYGMDLRSFIQQVVTEMMR